MTSISVGASRRGGGKRKPLKISAVCQPGGSLGNQRGCLSPKGPGAKMSHGIVVIQLRDNIWSIMAERGQTPK